MSQAHRASERISTELIEADFEIAFNLIDMARSEFQEGDRAAAARALQDAEDVFLDIERRLKLIGERERQCFDPLIGELKRAVGLAKSQEGSDHQSMA